MIPSKRLAENLLIGTWNLRAFGDLTKEWATPAGGSPREERAEPRGAMAMYHRENAQEAFLVLAGRCNLVVDG